ncbi:CBN-JMJC-1 protein [Aphelenchoides avenae]|nr:CBN-JMJC-1 protein [Aphelenchus avenae]
MVKVKGKQSATANVLGRRRTDADKRELEVQKKFEQLDELQPASVLRQAVSKGSAGNNATTVSQRKKKVRASDGLNARHMTVDQAVQEVIAGGLGVDTSLSSKRSRKRTARDEARQAPATAAPLPKNGGLVNGSGKSENIFVSIISRPSSTGQRNGAAAPHEDAKRRRVPLTQEDKVVHVTPATKKKTTVGDSADSSDSFDAQEDEEGYDGDSSLSSENVEDEAEGITDEEEDMSDVDVGSDVSDLAYNRFLKNDDFGCEPIELHVNGYSNKLTKQCVVLERKEGTVVSEPFKTFMFSTDDEHSVQVALKALRWMIAPMDIQTFFKDIFQKKALVIRRRHPKYHEGLFCTKDLVELVQNNELDYTTNINIAAYENGVRVTRNGKGRVYARNLQEHYQAGNSIQCVNPQTFDEKVWYLCEVLQEVFCSFVGANCYLTPAKSSGFAPHWDDIDAFLLQTEGRKHWTVHAPKEADEMLPLQSSGNFTASDVLYGGNCVFKGWLEEGDVLYLPRGFIHNAYTTEKHSLHLTVSVCREFSFTNLLESLVPELVSGVAQQLTQMRRSLPPSMLDMAGVLEANYDNEEALGEKLAEPMLAFMSTIKNSLVNFIPASVDIMAREFMKTALPPLLTPHETKLSAYGAIGHDILTSAPAITASSKVRLIRKHAQRLIHESEDSVFLAHRMANARSFGGRPEAIVDFPTDYIDGFVSLTNAYPKWVRVADLGLSAEENVELARLLFKHCLLLVHPFQASQQAAKDKPKAANVAQANKNSKKKGGKH